MLFEGTTRALVARAIRAQDPSPYNINSFKKKSAQQQVKRRYNGVLTDRGFETAQGHSYEGVGTRKRHILSILMCINRTTSEDLHNIQVPLLGRDVTANFRHLSVEQQIKTVPRHQMIPVSSPWPLPEPLNRGTILRINRKPLKNPRPQSMVAATTR